MRNYDQTSFAALKQALTVNSGEAIAAYQLALITNRTRADGLPLYRQHILWTGSGTMLIEQAFTANSSNGLRFKVYWVALEPTAGGITIKTLDRHRPEHYVWSWDVGSYSWLVTSSVMLQPASAAVPCHSLHAARESPAGHDHGRAARVGNVGALGDYFAQNAPSPSSPMGWTITGSTSGS